MSEPKNKEFQVTARLTFDVSIPVMAPTFEEALTIGRTWKPIDLMQLKARYRRQGFNDWEIELTGVWK